MNILVVEDRIRISHGIKEDLEEEGHKVILASNFYKASSVLDTFSIDCIITDLNMDDSSLSPTEQLDAKDGLFAGWAWLIHKVFRLRPEMKNRTIILSGYLPEFVGEHAPDEYKGVVLLDKGDIDSYAQGGGDPLVTAVRRIARSGK